MTTTHPPEPVDRRRLLHGAGLLAGAAGAAALLTAIPRTARAADGDPVRVGQHHEARSTTALRIGQHQGAAVPVLALTDVSGPVIGVENGDDPENTCVGSRNRGRAGR